MQQWRSDDWVLGSTGRSNLRGTKVDVLIHVWIQITINSSWNLRGTKIDILTHVWINIYWCSKHQWLLRNQCIDKSLYLDVFSLMFSLRVCILCWTYKCFGCIAWHTSQQVCYCSQSKMFKSWLCNNRCLNSHRSLTAIALLEHMWHVTEVQNSVTLFLK